jgi:hypothetical protein
MSDDRSTSWALFRKSAEDLVARLGEVQQTEAAAMAREARELAVIFQSWDAVRPTPTARIAAIQYLFDLNRRAMDFLSNQGRPAARPSTPSSRGPSSR